MQRHAVFEIRHYLPRARTIAMRRRRRGVVHFGGRILVVVIVFVEAVECRTLRRES